MSGLEGRVALVTGGRRGIGHFYRSHFAVPQLKAAARGGPYNVGKAGIEALAFTLSNELNQDSVYVNAVAPFGYVCRPDEVAQAVVYFCSNENSYGAE